MDGDVNDLLPYRVSSELCERTGNRDVFCMHELPSVHNAEHEIGRKLLAQAPNDFERTVIEEGLEITDECFEKNASVIFREAENRQHTIKRSWPLCWDCKSACRSRFARRVPVRSQARAGAQKQRFRRYRLKGNDTYGKLACSEELRKVRLDLGARPWTHVGGTTGSYSVVAGCFMTRPARIWESTTTCSPTISRQRWWGSPSA